MVVKWVRAAKAKAIRLIYDAKASVWTAIGPPLKYRETHPGIVQKILLREASATVYQNALEEMFYGMPSKTRFHHPSVHVYMLENVWVTGSEGHIFFEPNALFSVCSSVKGVHPKKIRRPISWLSRRAESPVFILSSRAPGNRGHFLTEHLPRLVASRDFLQAHGAVKILVTPGHRRWQVDYLKKLDIPESDVLEASYGAVFCPSAYFVPVLCEGIQTTISIKRDYTLIRDLFLVGCQPSSSRCPIFLSRKDAPDRQLINEDTVFQIVKDYFPSVRRVTLSSLSLDEQIELFQNASLVIGPHSQAFRNVLFSEDAIIVQLLQGFRDAQNEYYHWAKNYCAMAAINDNQCLNLFSEMPFYKNSNWIYPADKLRNDFRRLTTLIDVASKQH